MNWATLTVLLNGKGASANGRAQRGVAFPLIPLSLSSRCPSLPARGPFLPLLTRRSLLSRFAALLSAVAHDVGHTGFNNSFLINTEDPLAITYLYEAPLEHMHAAKAFELMRLPGCDVLNFFDGESLKECRKMMVAFILGTAMEGHFEHLASLNKKLDSVGIHLENSNDVQVSEGAWAARGAREEMEAGGAWGAAPHCCSRRSIPRRRSGVPWAPPISHGPECTAQNAAQTAFAALFTPPPPLYTCVAPPPPLSSNTYLAPAADCEHAITRCRH